MPRKALRSMRSCAARASSSRPGKVYPSLALTEEDFVLTEQAIAKAAATLVA